jgi:hypothetical protein
MNLFSGLKGEGLRNKIHHLEPAGESPLFIFATQDQQYQALWMLRFMRDTEYLVDKYCGIPIMETFTQPKITGYRQLSEQEVRLMNEGKALAEQVGEYIAKLRTYADVHRMTAVTQLTPPLDQRWISIGATQLQQGFMAVIRGIAQPTTF